MGSNIKRFEELEIRDDFMFGVIMRNPKYCKPFLETVLNIKIGHIEYPKSQEIIDLSADAKGVRLDVYVEDGKETVYNIEMQTTIDKNIPKRMRYYQGMIDLNILEKGYSGIRIIRCNLQNKEIIPEPCRTSAESGGWAGFWIRNP